MSAHPVVNVYEDNGGGVYLGIADEVWSFGPVTPDLAGRAAQLCGWWARDEWAPCEDDGQIRITGHMGATLVGYYEQGELYRITLDDLPVAGAGGLAFLSEGAGDD